VTWSTVASAEARPSDIEVNSSKITIIVISLEAAIVIQIKLADLRQNKEKKGGPPFPFAFLRQERHLNTLYAHDRRCLLFYSSTKDRC